MPDQCRPDNVIDLDALRPSAERHKALRDDRRREARHVCQERLFIQVQDSAARADLIGRTLPGWTVDISANGLQLVCGVALPSGTQVQAWVEITAVPGKFYLCGEVRWSRIADAGGYAIGLRLDERCAGTDTRQWRRLFGP